MRFSYLESNEYIYFHNHTFFYDSRVRNVRHLYHISYISKFYAKIFRTTVYPYKYILIEFDYNVLVPR